MMPRCHLLDIDAPISATSAKARLKEGWQLGRLPFGICSAGGLGASTHAIVSPDGQTAARVSDTAMAKVAHLSGASSGLPVIEVDTTILALDVPFSEKDEAKRLGALWSGVLKTWFAHPDKTARLERWLPSPERKLSLL